MQHADDFDPETIRRGELVFVGMQVATFILAIAMTVFLCLGR